MSLKSMQFHSGPLDGECFNVTTGTETIAATHACTERGVTATTEQTCRLNFVRSS